jgi:folate-binding protein YgfZ
MNHRVSHPAESPGSALFKKAGTGRLLRLRGPDSVDLLQRIAASEFVRQEDGLSFWSLFTNAKGRIVDLALGAKKDDEVFLLAGEGHGALLQQWLESFIITENVELIRDESSHTLSLYGADSAEVLAHALQIEPPARSSFLRAQERITFSEEEEAALHLTCPAADELSQRLVDAGARPLEEGSFELEQIQRGRFRPGLDLDERFHPLEVGLGEIVSWEKGCYVGQEVVARLKNYDKVRRTPAVLNGAPTARTEGELRWDRRACGQLVRTALQSDRERRIALAVVEKTLDEGAVLYDEDGAQWQLTARPERAGPA